MRMTGICRSYGAVIYGSDARARALHSQLVLFNLRNLRIRSIRQRTQQLQQFVVVA